MRIGFNPHKDKVQEVFNYLPHVNITLYFSNQGGSVKVSFKVLNCVWSPYLELSTKECL